MKKYSILLLLLCVMIFTTGCGGDYVKLYENGDYAGSFDKARAIANNLSSSLRGSYSSESRAKQDAANLAKAYYYMGLCKKAQGNSSEAKDYFRLASKDNMNITIKETKSKQVWVDGHYEKEFIAGHYAQGPWVPGHYEQQWTEGHYDTERVWVDGHYEGNVWVDGHYEDQQVWVDGHNSDVWVDGHYEQVWVEGHYDNVYVEGKYETQYYTETKKVVVDVSSEWSQRSKSEVGEIKSQPVNDVTNKSVTTDANLSLLKQNMDAAFNRYQAVMNSSDTSKVEKAKQEWLDAKKKYDDAKTK